LLEEKDILRGSFAMTCRINALIVAALLVGLVLAGCAGQPPAPAPTSPPQATYTPYPTYTPLPTQAPAPTNTPAPTVAAAQPTVAATNTPAPTPTPTPFVYTVKAGDWASSIAKRFGVTLQSLLTVNNIRNADLVETGQQLIIPISGTGTLTGTLPLTATLPGTRTVIWRPTPIPTLSPYPSEAATADPNQCDSHALLIFHTFWNDRPEPGVKFDIHSQPGNPSHDPGLFRFATDAKGTAYFCMPVHTRYYFYLDREVIFDARLDNEAGQVVEMVIPVPRLDLDLVAPLGVTVKPETPLTFSWKPYPGAAYYELMVYGEQRDNLWGGSPEVVAYTAQIPAPQTQATTSLKLDVVKGIYPGVGIPWTVAAFNARGTIIAKARRGAFSLLP
jgi:LysM repeat protein